MARRIAIAFALIICITIIPAYGEYYSASELHAPIEEKVTHLHFFLHDILSGKNPSALRIAQANLTNDKSPTPFGSLYAFDDNLRVGPKPTSKIVGNAQGLYLASSQDSSKFTIILYADFEFTTGKFNGSSISLFSRNPVSEGGVREVAVVGGRGKFRLAKGFAKIKTSYFNSTNGDAILEYKVTVIHY